MTNDIPTVCGGCGKKLDDRNSVEYVCFTENEHPGVCCDCFENTFKGWPTDDE